jgi:hypothetical protein
LNLNGDLEKSKTIIQIHNLLRCSYLIVPANDFLYEDIKESMPQIMRRPANCIEIA